MILLLCIAKAVLTTIRYDCVQLNAHGPKISYESRSSSYQCARYSSSWGGTHEPTTNNY